MKLQLGTSRFDRLTPEAAEWFRKPGWIHLGDAAPVADLPTRALESLRNYGLLNTLRIARTVLARKLTAPSRGAAAPVGDQPEVVPFFYQKGDLLPYADGQFSFIFSEHFFEHLFLDEAIALLGECFRVMSPGGVIRICVPDADLRTDHPPEMPGYPYRRMPFTHPEKHKTRWSVYSLGEALRIAGFRPIPLRYHDRHGAFHDHAPASLREKYPPTPGEAEFVFSLACVQRASSLIVDGIKP